MPLKKYINGSWVDTSYKRYETGTDAVTNLPVTILTDGQPVTSWTMKGNTTTSGTPSPSSPVTISGVGEETANLFNCNQTTGIIDNSYINKNTGEIASDNQYYISYPIPLEVGETYTWRFNRDEYNAHSAPTVGFYDSSDALISVAVHAASIKYFSFTVPNNCAYIRASVYKYANRQTQAMLNIGSEPLDFEPYGYKISILKDSQALTPIYLSQPLRKSLDGTAFDTLDSTGLVTYNVDEYGQPQTATTETVTVPTITTTGGTVTLDVDTTIKPSEMSLTYHGWHEHQPLKRENGSWS